MPPARRAILPAAALGALLVFISCGPQEGAGGITADIVFSDLPQEAGRIRQGISADQIRSAVSRLQIAALDAKGSTLAETNLYANPTSDQLRFDPHGGRWTLSGVKVGKDRQVAASAWLMAVPGISAGRYYQGRIIGIEVDSGAIANAGTLILSPIPGTRYPPLDDTAPSPPNPVSAMSVPEGRGLVVSFTRPPDPDVAGYLIALSSSVGAVGMPAIERGRQLMEGDTISRGLSVAGVISSPIPHPVTIQGLMNGRSYAVMVYAFDGDTLGRALNYSEPAIAYGIPSDTVAPGAILDLKIVLQAGTAFQISFTGPGDHGNQGTPAAYDLRVSTDRTKLDSADAFALLPMVQAPPPLPAGSSIMFTRTAAELGIDPALPFFVGLRAIGDSGNEGPIAVAAYSATSTGAPAIRRISPEIAVAGQDVTLMGSNFGSRTPTVSLTFTTTTVKTLALHVESAGDSSALVRIPLGAASGTVSLSRADGQIARAYLPVLARADGVLGPLTYPFELLSKPVSKGTLSVLYREKDVGGMFEGAIERAVDLQALGTTDLPVNVLRRGTAIAGTYAPQQDRFFFMVSNATVSMSAAFISSSTAAPNALRLDTAVAAGGADRVAVEVLGPGGPNGEIPAMVAFSLAGVVRAATVADARADVFNRFNTYTSSTGQLDRATLRSKSDGALLLAYRNVKSQKATLVLRTNTTGRPGDFMVLPAATPVDTGTSFEILAVPTTSGQEEFVLVYEALDAAGATDVRILRIAEYGRRSGIAPFAHDTLRSRNLEDAGLVRRGQQTWIAVLARRTTPTGDQAEYTEVALGDLSIPDGETGFHPGAVIDTAPAGSHGRIGCKRIAAASCAIAWLGPSTDVFFLRR